MRIVPCRRRRSTVSLLVFRHYKTACSRIYICVCLPVGDVLKFLKKLFLLPGWLYGALHGQMGTFPEDSVKTLSRKEVSRNGSFNDTRSRHSSGKVSSHYHYTLTVGWMKKLWLNWNSSGGILITAPNKRITEVRHDWSPLVSSRYQYK